MTINRRNFTTYALAISALLVSFLGGAFCNGRSHARWFSPFTLTSVSAQPGSHSHIKFRIEPGTDQGMPRLILAPEVGDDVTWWDQSGKNQIAVSFGDGTSPCTQDSPVTKCVIKDSPGIHEYQCVDVNGKPICEDPAINPRGAGVPQVKRKKKHRPRVMTASLQVGDALPTLQVSNALGDLHPVISCDKDQKVHVYTGPVGNQDTNSADTPLMVTPLQGILWSNGGTSGDIDFTAKLDAGICDATKAVTIDANHRRCVVIASFSGAPSYVLTTRGSNYCSKGASSTFYLQKH